MDYFHFLKECLMKFHYPNIHSMDDMEVADVFSNTNRQFLVVWILNQINKKYAKVVENASKEDLAEIVHRSGFCGSSEKLKFMNGECDSKIQFEILYRMFKHMDCLSDKENQDVVKPFSEEELQNFIDFDTNLFSVYGHKQTLNSTQRKLKMQGYRNEIQHLKSVIEMNRSKDVKTTPPSDTNLKCELSRAVNELETNLPEFTRSAFCLMKNKNCESASRVNFKENLAQTLEESNKQAATLSNFIANTNVVLSCKACKLDLKGLDGNNRSGIILRNISGLCKDVTTTLKRNI